MPQEKKRFREIDVLKGVAIAMVILGHSIIVFPIDLSEIPWCNYLHWLISSVHMPLFFAISGYCFSFRGWNGYLRKKCRRILVPFLVFSLLGVAAKTLAPSVVNGGSAPLGKALVSILTGGSHWFLYTLFVIFLFFPFIRKCFETSKMGLICLVVLGTLQMFTFWPSLFNLDNIAKYSFFFALGYFCKCMAAREPGQAARLLHAIKHPITILLCVSVWALLTLIRIRLDEETQLEAAAQTAVAAVTPLLEKDGFLPAHVTEFCQTLRQIPLPKESLLSLGGLVTLAAALAGFPAVIGLSLWFTKLRASRLFETAGKDSLQLYLFNGYLLTVTRWLVVTKLHIHTPLIIIGANFFVMFFVSLAIIELVVKRVKLFRTLTGLV